MFIVLAAVEPTAERLAGASGIRLALAATVVFGLYLFALTTLTDDLGWLLPILLTRAVAVTLMAAFFAARPDGDRRPLGRAIVLACVAAGALDAFGYLMFNRGAELGEVAITSAAASAYPLIPILVGLIAYRERVAWYQLVGVGGRAGGDGRAVARLSSPGAAERDRDGLPVDRGGRVGGQVGHHAGDLLRVRPPGRPGSRPRARPTPPRR